MIAAARPALAATLLLAGCATPSAPPPAAPAAAVPAGLPKVSFPNSFVHELPSASGRRYQVWVDVPASYTTSNRTYPVVFVTDPNWSFPVVRAIRDVTGQRGRNIEEFVLVGLTHDQDLASPQSRARDYTPSDPRRSPAHDPRDYDFPVYGEAPAYLDYIVTRVFPLVAANYRVDMRRRTYAGHSYGGLFGAWTLVTRPETFNQYLLGSPSLWFDRKLIFTIEAAAAQRRRDLAARVHMVTGGYETVRPEPRYDSRNDLVEDMLRFERTLAGRGYQGLTITSEVVDGEDHLTVYPDVATRGLLKLLPGHGPYTGG